MDKDEIRRLYEQYGTWIHHRALSFLKNEQEAWEAVQDVFIKVIESGSGFRGDSSPWTWLYRITTNHCLNLIRSRKSFQKAMEGLGREQLRLSQEPQQSDYSVLIDRQWIVQQMSDEDETTRRIIVSYYFDDMTQEEIVDTLKISRKTVYKKLKKFMKKARGNL